VTRPWIALALASLLAATTAARVEFRAPTGSIRGRVAMPDARSAPQRPAAADLSTRRPASVDRTRAVVYLESAPRLAFDDLPAGRARMDQRGEQFVPRVLAITVGTVVDFPNSDTTFHNVFSLARVRTFDLGRYPPGRTGAVRFDRPGIVPIFCDIHSHMSAYVLVFSHPFYAVTTPRGEYTIAGVPPGVYTVMVWSELGRAEPQRVTVADNGSATVDFEVGRQP
jgi:plastocyanin